MKKQTTTTKTSEKKGGEQSPVTLHVKKASKEKGKIKYGKLEVQKPSKKVEDKKGKGDMDAALSAAKTVTPATPAKVSKPKDLTKYTFESVEGLGKGPLALAVVRHYIKKQKTGVTLAQLKKAFPDSLLPKYGVVEDLKRAKERSTGRNRFFLNEDQVLTLKDGKAVVCNQWTSDLFVPFLKHAREVLGYTIK